MVPFNRPMTKIVYVRSIVFFWDARAEPFVDLVVVVYDAHAVVVFVFHGSMLDANDVTQKHINFYGSPLGAC